MEVGILAKLRNGPLLRYRMEEGGITGVEAARRAGVSGNQWCAAETMNFKKASWPGIKRIAELVGESPHTICPEVLRKTNLSLQRVAYAEVQAERLLAADLSMRLVLPSPADVVCEEDSNEDLQDRLKKALKTLTYREQEVLKLRFGLEGEASYTLEEIGRIYKLTRDRIRQIEANAIRKLQHPVRARILNGCLSA